MMFLEELFRLTLSLSLAGGAASLLVLGLKALTRDRLGPGWNYYIWLLPLALYLMPVSLPGLGGALAAQAGGEAKAAVQAVMAAGQVPAGTGSQAPAVWDSLAGFWQQVLPVLAWVWLLGMFFAAALRLMDGRSIAASLEKCCRPPEDSGKARQRFQKALAEAGIPQGKVELTICPGVESPLLIGLLRPRVVLPREDYPDARLDMIFRHELGHYRGRDLWYKGLALAVACIHWFNPLAWQLARDLDRCSELWCDRRTTGGMTDRERRQYGRMLLDVAQDGSPLPTGAVPLATNKKDLRRRLALLKKGGQTTLLERAVAGAAALTVTVAGVAWADAVNPGQVFQGPQTPADSLVESGRTDPVPELWGEGGEQPDSIPQPNPTDVKPQAPLQMQVVLSDEAQAAQPPAADGDDLPGGGEPEDGGAGDTIALEPDDASDEAVPEEEEEADQSQPTLEDFTYELTDEEEDGLSWDGGFLWPVDGGYIGVGFRGYYGHTGADILAPAGTEIYAAADGIVSYAGNYSIWPYGKRVDIDHGDGMVTRYAHCSRVLVQAGEEVKQGQLIALVGCTGNATTNHCHFEVRRNGTEVDPESYIGSAYSRNEE